MYKRIPRRNILESRRFWSFQEIKNTSRDIKMQINEIRSFIIPKKRGLLMTVQLFDQKENVLITN